MVWMAVLAAGVDKVQLGADKVLAVKDLVPLLCLKERESAPHRTPILANHSCAFCRYSLCSRFLCCCSRHSPILVSSVPSFIRPANLLSCP